MQPGLCMNKERATSSYMTKNYLRVSKTSPYRKCILNERTEIHLRMVFIQEGTALSVANHILYSNTSWIRNFGEVSIPENLISCENPLATNYRSGTILHAYIPFHCTSNAYLLHLHSVFQISLLTRRTQRRETTSDSHK